jgi:ABC-2 type transport system permease protein
MPDGIADLTYRRYEGSLGSTRSRWKVVAKATMRGAFRKRSMWVLCVISMWYYLAMSAVLYFFQSQAAGAAAAGTPGGGQAQKMVETIFSTLVWKDQFLHGIGFGNLFYFIIALIIGSGVIANDFRSNALLVYLSKPLSKTDYLVGKWMGVFIPMLIAIAIPHLLFFLYGALSFADRGFLSNDPWMIFKILLIIILSAAFYASLIVGVSSMFRSGRLAAATLAGIYFLSTFFKGLMASLVYMKLVEGPMRDFAEMGTHMSIEGVVRGMAKFVLNTDGSPPFINSGRQEQVIGRPPFLFVLITLGGIIALGFLVARARVRAVEIVK